MTYGVYSEEDRRRARELEEWHAEWSAEMVAKGVNPAVPAGRPEPSDYNQHGPDMDASGADLDRYFARANQIMGIAQQ